jgi:hypothetical protein
LETGHKDGKFYITEMQMTLCIKLMNIVAPLCTDYMYTLSCINYLFTKHVRCSSLSLEKSVSESECQPGGRASNANLFLACPITKHSQYKAM